MLDFSLFDERPLVIAVAGPNGAGKTLFYYSHLQDSGLRLVNANKLAKELQLDPYVAADAADALRRALVRRRESFVFETVFSDPAFDKIAFLKETAEDGYTVVLCFIGIDGPEMSEQRVAMRVSQGGHDVPEEKLQSRFPRTLANLKSALHELPHVLVFDNNDLGQPFRRVAVFERGRPLEATEQLPQWLQPMLEE